MTLSSMFNFYVVLKEFTYSVGKCYWPAISSIIVSSIGEKDDYLSTNVRLEVPKWRRNKKPKIAARKVAGFVPSNSVQDIEMQKVGNNSNAKIDAILSKYGATSLNTIVSWYKRSNLVKNKKKGSKESTLINNTKKYESIKSELEPLGVSFIEKKTHVTIKF